MTPMERAERVFDKAKREGLVNPMTGDGMPTLEMVAEAIEDVEYNKRVESYRARDDWTLCDVKKGSLTDGDAD